MPILVDGKIYTGFLRERTIIKKLLGVREMYIPEPAFNYAKRIAEITGLPLSEVLKSRPVRNLIERWTRYVKIQV